MNKTFLDDIKSKNSTIKREILRLCILHESYSIADLSKEINASVPTVTKLLSELIDDGFILDLGKLGTSGGRRPSIFGLNEAAGYFVGVDIARQHFHIAITDFKGSVVAFIQDIEFVLEAKADSFKNMCKIVKEKVSESGVSWNKVLSVGVSLSGRVNPEEGYSMSYFMSDDLPLNAIFQKELDVPVSIENDSRAMAFGEYLAGKHGLTEKNMLSINLSWGLGMGMILDGALYYGKSGFSGEIGHFPLLDNDRICRCGKIGCLETGASGSALHRMIKEQLAAGRTSALSTKYKAGEEITLDDILKAVEDEDVLAIEGIGKVGETLGRAIAGLINIFNPGLVIIGGRLIVGKNYLMYPIKTSVNKYSLNRVSSDTKIKFSTLGRSAASIGNCLIARNKLLGIM
ncbi:MAG: ROK family transcriptional regulator [Bacteroidales bacterium]|nr:ROK family transcriptional regulator [Candidatus Cryptobacteroides onthequi]MCQ2165573.1 ROK family transcriptional regulator [Bacteroidales bacterium]